MIRVFRVGVISAAALVTVLAIFGIRDFSRSPYTGIQHYNLIIQSVESDSPNLDLSLQPRDKIIAVDGRVARNLNHFKFLTYQAGTLKPQIYDIARGDSVFQVQVKSVRQGKDRIYSKFALMLVGFTFILVGFIVIIKRPDILGSLFVINCFIFAFVVTERPVTPVQFFHITGELIYDFLFIFLPAFFLHFFIIFPGKEIVKGSRRSLAVRILYFPPTVIFISSFLVAMFKYSTGTHPATIDFFNTVTAIYWFLYMVLSLASFVRTYQTSVKVQKIKFRIVIVGLVMGVIPFSTVMLIKQFQPTLNIPYGNFSAVFLSFISISFAYAILKHDAFDLGFVVRKSLVFLILFGLLIMLYYILVNVLEERFFNMIGLDHSFVIVIAGALIIAIFLPARAGIQWIVDKAFYGHRKIFRAEFIEFSRKIQFFLSLDEISGFITREIFEIFNAEQIHFFIKSKGGNYALNRSYPGDRRIPLTSFPPNTQLIQLIRDRRLPVMVEYFDRLWIKSYLDRMSHELLYISKVSVVVPLIDQHELLGFILVGRKKSGKPYTSYDAEVFELIGERSAVSIRSIELYSDSIEKEKLQEELRLAKEIQERLLPDSLPNLMRAGVRGGIRTSREVGGDFYDFVELAPGKIGIAVADVSGKGIPATILMTTLQASFRAEASRDRSPSEVLSALNKSLFKRSDPTKFATFFYAMYDDTTGILHYSNGGSFPPFILKADGSVSRLQQGGILIGIEEESRYNQGVIKLIPGDTLVIYTDGLIDQENEKGEHFGEQRLIEYFRNNLNQSLDYLIDKLFATCIAFGLNNLKDDITVVLLRKNIP